MINEQRRSRIDWKPTEREASKVRKRTGFSRGFLDTGGDPGVGRAVEGVVVDDVEADVREDRERAVRVRRAPRAEKKTNG